MSRHSKWSKVKQFKGAIDAKRSASFTKLARVITVEAREKGGDPEMNAGLRAAIGRAREASMPKDAIERAIQKGAGGGEEGRIESLIYEAYAPGGTALIIESLTDNRNRTAGEIKHLLTKAGGSLAASGSVTYLFDHLAVVRAPTPSSSPSERGRGLSNEMELTLIDAGAANMIEVDGGIEIQAATKDLSAVSEAATKLGLTVTSAEFEWIAKSLVEVDEESGSKAAELIDELENHDDVSRVFHNLG